MVLEVPLIRATRLRRNGWTVAITPNLIALALCVGCGSGMNFPTGDTDPGFDEDAPISPKAPLEGKKDLRPGSRLAKATSDEPPPAASGGRPAELPPLIAVPDDLAQWQAYDFHTARVRNDPRLIAAIEARKDRKMAANAHADAELFRNLLTPVKRTAKPAGARPQAVEGVVRRPPGALIEAIAAALAANNSSTARRTLEGMVTGTVPTDDSRAAAKAAIHALASKQDDALDELLFRLASAGGGTAVVTAGATDDPEQPAVVVPRTGGLTQPEALALVSSSGSVRLRARLARHAVEASTPAGSRSSLIALLAQPDARNIEAHAILYQSDRSDDGLRATLRRQLTQSSSATLASLLNLPAVRAADSPQPVQPGGDLRAQDVVRCLWTTEFLQSVQRQRKGTESASERAQLVALGCTMPLDAVRRSLRRAFERSWDEGPGGLEAAKLAEVVCDPGLLVVLKTILPRTAAPPRAVSTAPKATRPAPAGAVNPALAKTLKAREQLEKTHQPWRRFAESLLRNQCRQFRAAALAREKEAAGVKKEADDPGMAQPDGTLFRTAPTAVYRFRWPDDVTKRTAGVSWDAMQVTYLRFEEKHRPATVARYYRRCLPGSREHESAQGLWVESLRSGAEPGRLRSTDVLITRAAGGTVEAAGQEQELTVEFLVVEINSPLEGEQVAGR